VDVSVPRLDRRRRSGIRVHRSTTLDADEVTTRDAIRVTTVPRTLRDLASCEIEKVVERAVSEALIQSMTTNAELARITRDSRRPGAARLRKLLETIAGGGPIRSDTEDRLRDLLERAQLPRPATNVVVEGRERDFVWKRERLVVEVDGFKYHATPARFESDRRRDAELVAAGYRVLRVTWRQLQEESVAVIARIAQALAR
jgi:very-short-patch-repair endonuclease